MKENGPKGPYNLRDRYKKDLVQNKSIDLAKPESLGKMTRPIGLEEKRNGENLGVIEPKGSNEYGPTGPYNKITKEQDYGSLNTNIQGIPPNQSPTPKNRIININSQIRMKDWVHF